MPSLSKKIKVLAKTNTFFMHIYFLFGETCYNTQCRPPRGGVGGIQDETKV